MNAEVQQYRILIMNLNRIGREIDVAINYISRYQRYIISGLLANDSKSFDQEVEPLKDALMSRRDRIYNSIIPALRVEMQEAMMRGKE